MKKKMVVIFAAVLALAFAAGCGEPGQNGEAASLAEREAETQEPSVTEVYACGEENDRLADFLAGYYQVPEEYRAETRYYYNYTDLNDDGEDEIFAVVVGEHTEQDNGDPALLLAENADGSFTVLKSLDGIRTPVLICERTTNGWHDFVYKVYGFGTETGYRLCSYRKEGGYGTDEDELLDEMPLLSGTQILSNNLIDDLDQGRYLTLAGPPEDSR